MKRIALWLAGTCLALLIVVPTIAWYMLKQTDLREWVSQRVAQATGIQVDMDGYELRFPATLRVRGLSVQAPSGMALTADSVVARPSLLKLLTGSLYLKSVTVDGASVTVPMGLPAAVQTEPPAGTRPERTGPVTLPLGLLRITNAAIHLKGPERTVDITGVTVEVRPGTSARISLFPGHPDNRLTLNANLTPDNRLKDLEGKLSIHQVGPMLALAGVTATPITGMTGTLAVTLVPEAGGYRLNGKLDVPTMTIAIGNQPVAYPLAGTFTVQAASDGSRIVLNQAAFTIRDISLHLSGPIHPILKLSLNGNRLRVQSLVSLIPPSETPFPPDFRFSGFATLTGSMTTSNLHAAMTLKEVRLAIPGVAPIAINGGINVSTDQIRIPGLFLTGPWIDLQLEGDIRDYLSDHGTTQINLKGKVLDLTRLAPAPAPGGKPVSDRAETVREPVTLTYPDFEGMAHTVQCSLGSLLLPGATINDLSVRLTAADEAIRLSRCTGKVLDGTVSFTAGMVPSGKEIRFQLKGSLNRVRLTGLLSDRLPVSGGRLSSRFQLDATGDNTLALKQHANGEVSFHVTDAVLRDTPAVRKVEGITRLQLAGRKVDRFDGSGHIRDGLITLSDTKLTARGIQVQMGGTVSLMGDLNLQVPIRIDGESAAVLPDALKLLENEGSVTVPLKITGTVRKPIVRPDTRALSKAVGKKLKDKLKNKFLKGLFGN